MGLWRQCKMCVYLQYTNLCGWQVRVLALLQVSLWVDLSIEQSDRKAPETQRRERTAWWSVRLLFRDTVTVCSCQDNIHWFKLFLLTLQWSRRHKRPGRIWQTVQRWRGTARLQDPPIPRWTDWPETHKKQVKYFSAFTLISKSRGETATLTSDWSGHFDPLWLTDRLTDF